MNKKRGVIMSTTDHTQTIAKSHSAHTNPLAKHFPLLPSSQSGALSPLDNEVLAESNFVSEDPQRMVNNAYYTYDDPDNLNNIRYDDNEEYVIESMVKKEQQAKAR